MLDGFTSGEGRRERRGGGRERRRQEVGGRGGRERERERGGVGREEDKREFTEGNKSEQNTQSCVILTIQPITASKTCPKACSLHKHKERRNSSFGQLNYCLPNKYSPTVPR